MIKNLLIWLIQQIIINLFVISFIISNLSAQPIYEWRGSSRFGKFNESGLLKKWPEQGPKLLWKSKELGKGYSSVVATPNAIFVTGLKNNQEVLNKLDNKGNILWTVEYGKPWDGTYPDSRSSPVIQGNSVYVASGSGEIACFNAVDGKIVWKIDVKTVYGGESGKWGYAETPLIVDNFLVFSPGGSQTTMVAFDKQNGKEVWKTKSLEDEVAYVSAIYIEMNKQKIIISVTGKYIYGVLAQTGEILWKYDYYKLAGEGVRYQNNANSAIFRNNSVFVTSGYDHTGVMLKLSDNGKSVEYQWHNNALDSHIGGAVEVDGYIYGSNWINNKQGKWVCLEWATGKLMWENEWNTKGSIVYADGLLYCYEEGGSICIAKPDTEKFNVVSSFKLEGGNGQHWAHLSIASGILLVRNGDYVFAYELKE